MKNKSNAKPNTPILTDNSIMVSEHVDEDCKECEGKGWYFVFTERVNCSCKITSVAKFSINRK